MYTFKTAFILSALAYLSRGPTQVKKRVRSGDVYMIRKPSPSAPKQVWPP